MKSPAVLSGWSLPTTIRYEARPIELKPAPHWDVSLEPSFSRSNAAAQYLLRLEDPAATNTYGQRYVFARLDQNTFAVDTRVNYTFTPGLSLQVFMQPFVASGNFGPPKEFARPGSFEFLEYGRDIGEIANGRVYPTGQASGGPSFALPEDRSFGVPQDD